MSGEKKSKIITVIAIVVAALFVILSSSTGSSSSSGRSWSDLNEQEKDNARWAYYAQQAADNYDR